MTSTHRSLVALLVLLMLGVGNGPTGPRSAYADQEDASTLLDLSERLLAPPPGIAGGRAIVRLFPGEPPDGFPFDLPIPQGGRLLGSRVDQDGLELVLDAPGSPDEVEGFYADAVSVYGWAPPPPGSPGAFPRPGPLSDLEPRSQAYCARESDGTIRVAVSPLADGPNDVRV